MTTLTVPAKRPVTASAFAGDAPQILAILVLAQPLGQALEIVGPDQPFAERDLLDAGDLEPLALLDRAHELARLEQRFVGPGIEPGGAAPELLHGQTAALQIDPIDVGDLELAARRRLDRLGDRDDVVVVEIEPGDGGVR